MKRRILYIEDMSKCFRNTQRALGEEYSLDWKRDSSDAIKAIENINQYDAAIIDINLNYNPLKPNNEQIKEGLNLIKILREKAKGVNLPIFCVSSENNKEAALNSGADVFMWKKEFWSGKGKEELEKILKTR